MNALEARVSALELCVFGASEATATTKDTAPIEERVRKVQEKVSTVQAKRSELGDLASAYLALNKSSPCEGVEMLRARANNIAALDLLCEEIKELSKSEGIEQSAHQVQPIVEREATLSKLSADRAKLREEIVGLLQAYSQWIDSVSEEMVTRLS